MPKGRVQRKKRKQEEAKAAKKREAEAKKAAKKAADGEKPSKRRKRRNGTEEDDAAPEKADHRGLQRIRGSFTDKDPQVLVDGAQFATSCRLTPAPNCRKFLKSILLNGMGLLRLKKGSVKKILTESMEGGFPMTDDAKAYISSSTQVPYREVSAVVF